jgi:type I restriction enzyme S subunit
MKVTNLDLPVMSSWIEDNALRLDSAPYLSGAMEARILLDRLRVKKEPLQSLTLDEMDGLINPGRISRVWVNDPKHGVPFLSSTDILQADLSNLSVISKKAIKLNPKLIIHEGWTLITRSGTIGRMAYCRPNMSGMACSEDVLRVVPDPAKILPGYLYAYLSSRFGVPLVVFGTYGAIIQHIEPHHIADIPIARLEEKIEIRIHELIANAATNRTEAAKLFSEASLDFINYFGFMKPKPIYKYERPNVNAASSCLTLQRMDAYYFAKWNEDAYNEFTSVQTNMLECIGDIADQVYIPNIFKRLYAEDAKFGHPYLTGSEVYRLRPTSDRYLSKKVPGIERLIIHDGMILVQDSGQLGGLIGRPVPVGRHLDGFACTNNMVRIVPRSKIDQGYIFTVLNTDYGIRLLSRESTGSSIPHLEERRIKRIQIPWPDRSVREALGRKVLQAIQLRDDACDLEVKATIMTEDAIQRGQAHG